MRLMLLKWALGRGRLWWLRGGACGGVSCRGRDFAKQ